MKKFSKVAFLDACNRYEKGEVDEKGAGALIGCDKRTFKWRYNQFKDPDTYGEIPSEVFNVPNPVTIVAREAKDLPKLEF